MIDCEKFKTAHIGMLRRIRCLTGGGGGVQRIFYLDLIFNVKSCNYGGIKVWLGGRKARQTRFLVGKALKSSGKDLFYPTTHKNGFKTCNWEL